MVEKAFRKFRNRENHCKKKLGSSIFMESQRRQSFPCQNIDSLDVYILTLWVIVYTRCILMMVMTIDPRNIFVRYDYIIRFSGLEDCDIILILISLLLYLCLWSYCGSKCFPRLLERKIMYMTKRYWPTIWMKEHVLLKCLLLDGI